MEHFRELKQGMLISRDGDRRKLTTLTLQSDACMKELERRKEKVRSD